jgi:hypothetical protein
MPQIVQTQKLSNSLENRLEYYSYDANSHPLSLSKDKDRIISYIWGYNNLYPIAQAVNSSLSNIAYTSFEDFSNNSGNWTLSSTTRVSGSGVTGNQCYNLSGSSVVMSPTLNSSITYVVSYWTTGSSPLTISGTVSGFPIQGKTINGWTYYEDQITGVTSFTLSGSAYIDELRLYPNTALMTTYSYTPLVGKTSECDASNKITYYQYDPYNRLDIVLDQDHNIIKKYCYDYAGQPSNCNGSFALNCQYNISYASWNIQLTSVLTGNVYTFSLGDYVGNTINLGTVPTGMYNVQISEIGSSASHTMYFANYSQTGNSMTLSNVPLSSTTNFNLPD